MSKRNRPDPNLPPPPITVGDADLARAAQVLLGIERAVGHDRELRMAALAFARAGGFTSFEDMVARGGSGTAAIERPWRWLLAVAREAQRRDDLPLVARACSFISIWCEFIGPQLTLADQMDMGLHQPSTPVWIEFCTMAVTALGPLPPQQIVAQNDTGAVPAEGVRRTAAKQLQRLAGEGHAVSPVALAAARAFLDGPKPPPPPPPGPDLSDLERDTAVNIDRLKVALSALDLRYVELTSSLGRGVGVPFSETDFVVLSIMIGNPHGVNLAGGVLADVQGDRLTILNACNRRTCNNPAYAVFLHEAEQGTDILMATAFPLAVLLQTTSYLDAMVRGFPSLAGEAREEFSNDGVVGRNYRWHDDDRHRLLMRSML